MQDQTSVADPGVAANGAAPKAPGEGGGTPPLPVNQRSPKGKCLPDYAVEYFNQLVAQYLTLPGVDPDPRNLAANELAKYLVREQQKQEEEGQRFHWPWERKKHDLNWADVSGMEMALLQLLPEAYLQRYAWNLRARYHEVAGQSWYDGYQQSKPPGDGDPPHGDSSPGAGAEGKPSAVSVTSIPRGATGFFLLTPAPPEPPVEAPPGHSTGDSPAAATLRADLSILLSDLQRLRSTINAREEKNSRISRIGAMSASISLLLALFLYGAPGFSPRSFAGLAVPTRSAIVAAPVPAAPTPPVKPATPTAVTPGTKDGGPAAPVAPPEAISSPLQVLQVSALVILCGVLGGLISMLRRLQALPAGNTPLLDTIALNAGQFGISLAPTYGGIFAMMLYLIFLSNLPASIIASSVEGVFPKFTDATPATTPDAAKLLVWAFVAGFAEQLVPDVLNRLTARNAAKAAEAAGADTPPR